MEVKINKEVRNYTESIFLGLSFRQCIFSILACSIAVIIYFSCIDTLGMEITSWLCMLGAAPFASLGFITYQSMNAEQIAINAWHSFLLSHKDLIDKPFNLYYKMYYEILMNKKRKEKTNDKKLFKIKKTKQRKV